SAILNIASMTEPATAQLVSLPDTGDPLLNVLYLRSGRTPDPTHPDEVVVNEPFAKAHGFTPGASFGAIINGRERTLRIVGIALSPEFVYTLAPGSLLPDDRRYAILWMSRRALAAAVNLEGAFSAL